MAAEEFVLRIGVDESFVRVGPETVGAAEDEAAHELFRRAALFAEGRGEPVEQLGMGRAGAEAAKVVDRLDEP